MENLQIAKAAISWPLTTAVFVLSPQTMSILSDNSSLYKKLTTSIPVSQQRARGTMKLKSRKLLLILLLTVCLVIFVYGFCVILKLPIYSQYNLVRAYVNKSTESDGWRRPRTILLWNSFFGDPRWSLSEDTIGPAYFRDKLHCPVYRCELTNVRDLLPSVEMYDAVLFHAAEMFPIFNSLPAHRSPDQAYVFAVMEPPGETKHVLSDENAFYNLTMTYRLDSDILWPYKYIVGIENGAYMAPAMNPVWQTPPATWNDSVIWELWPGKVKSAAWFVSHCKTLSEREKLAAELQRYMEVDIFGKCGPLRCPRKSKDCDNMLNTQYKFYLAFENSLCTDYVTEKLYNALQHNVIPVVYGGANYTRFMPPHSYIDAESFETVSALAAYLRYLETHPAEYMRYFWWRSKYQLGYQSPFCELCAKLHSANHREKIQFYQNIEKWWLQDSCRLQPKIKF